MKHTPLGLSVAIILALWVGAGVVFAQGEPPLPQGLSEEKPAAEGPSLPAGLAPPGEAASGEPTLPSGLAQEKKTPSGEPALPEGLAEEPKALQEAKADKKRLELPFDLSGFWEARGGVRTQRDLHERDASIGETRLQLEAEKAWELLTVQVSADFVYDPVLDQHEIRLEEGRGWLDLRQANVFFAPASFVDVKVGRQILTWGTGDLLFLNDLFPKDFNSFFIGRDEEYLKAPSDAMKVGLFSELANANIVYTPWFDTDRFIDVRRISFFDQRLGTLSGRDAVVQAEKPDEWFEDYEVAGRLYRNLGGYELAAYGYRGFWKSPAGQDPISGSVTFPGLWVYGASARGAVAKGIGNVEFAYYDSEDDRRGTDPFVKNSEWRLLAGYEQEVAKDFTAALQYYVELMTDYDDFRRTMPPGVPLADEDRHVLTLRLTKLLMSQNLKLSFFAFYSPTDDDAYLRPIVHYKIDDHWSAEVGGNVFFGKDDHTFFGQFEKNTNAYMGLRYGF